MIYNLSNYQKTNASNELEYISDKHRYQVFSTTDNLAFRGNFQVPQGDYTIKSYMIDQEHGSPYDTWLKMGAPEPLNAEIINALCHTSYMDIHFNHQNNTDQIHLEAKIKVHGILLYEISRH